MLSVFYDVLPHKLINGSLFYAFEHYVKLSEFTDTNLYLYKCSDTDLQTVIEIFKDKYNVKYNSEKLSDNIYNNIYNINSIRELYKIKTDKSLFLDGRSFNNIYQFINSDVVVYNSHVNLKKFKSKIKDIKWFGYYDYQDFDIKEKLQLNFSIFKDIKPKKTDTAFFSSSLADSSELFKFAENIKESKVLSKVSRTHTTNLFEEIDTLYYVHINLDVNNRMIPEAFYYKKNIEIIQPKEMKPDSILHRYNDIKENGLQEYTLTKDSLIIQEMLRDIKNT